MHRFMIRSSLRTLIITIASATTVTAISAFSGQLDEALGDYSLRVAWAMVCISIAMLIFLGIDAVARCPNHDWKTAVFSLLASVGGGFALSFPQNMFLLIAGTVLVIAMVLFSILFTTPDEAMTPDRCNSKAHSGDSGTA